MTLAREITALIEQHGGLSVADYMARCNAHYYATRDPFGAQGDFTTAPEISQIFGELVGAWLADAWERSGKPEAVLCELGPGRGTLMKDALRATRNIAGFHDAVEVCLVETSPRLQQLQQHGLSGAHPRISWQEDCHNLPALPLFLIANEFFDALPVEQYVGHAERKVMLDSGKLHFMPAGNVTSETSPASLAVMRVLAEHLNVHGGAMLIIDYGYYHPSPRRGEDGRGAETHHYPIPHTLHQAQQLRKNLTDAEKLLWSKIRSEQLGVKFRKQHPIGGYIADFACLDLKLILELDGGQHGQGANIIKDEKRSLFLESQGFQVLRFWNNEILENTDGVLQVIAETIKDRSDFNSPHPNPPPTGEGIVGSDTLQAVRAHHYVNPLEHPGEADLTAHVDFAALACQAERCGVMAHGVIEQGTFLKRLGAELRATALCRNATPEQREAILSGLERIVAPHHMGRLFKVLAVTSSVEAPAGF